MSFAGLLVVGYCGFKVYLGVRRLGRELDRTRRRLEREHTQLSAELQDLQDSRAPHGPADGVRSS